MNLNVHVHVHVAFYTTEVVHDNPCDFCVKKKITIWLREGSKYSFCTCTCSNQWSPQWGILFQVLVDMPSSTRIWKPNLSLFYKEIYAREQHVAPLFGLSEKYKTLFTLCDKCWGQSPYQCPSTAKIFSYFPVNSLSSTLVSKVHYPARRVSFYNPRKI